MPFRRTTEPASHVHSEKARRAINEAIEASREARLRRRARTVRIQRGVRVGLVGATLGLIAAAALAGEYRGLLVLLGSMAALFVFVSTLSSRIDPRLGGDPSKNDHVVDSS